MAKVSICIPSYNHARFIADCIGSIIRQSFLDWELIITDDASSDNTEDVVRPFLSQDHRVKFYRNPKNLGMVANWNRSLFLATGEYVKVLGSDDFLEPDCLQRAVDVLDNHPQVGVVACARSYVDAGLQPVRTIGYARSQRFVPGEKAIAACLARGNPIGEPVAVTFRRQAAVRGFSPDYNQLADVEMWMHLLRNSDLAFDPEPLCRFRHHPQQCTRENMKKLSFVQEEFRLTTDYQDCCKGVLAPLFLEKVRFRKSLIAWRYLKQGHDPVLIKQMIEESFGLAKFRFFYPFRSLIKKF